MASEEPVRVVRAEGFSYQEMVAAIRRAGAAFLGLLRSLDSEEAGKPVPGLDWTVGQTAAHVVGILMRGTGDRRRAASALELGDLNLLQLTEINPGDLAKTADLLEERLNRQLSGLPLATGDEPFELHAGLHASVKTALSYELWDLLVHGWDIARATGREWDIDAADAALTLTAGLPALRPWALAEVCKGRARRAAFAFPDSTASIAVTVGHGNYQVALGQRDDAAVEVDPVTLLLALSKRVESAHPAVAEMTSWFLPI